MLVVESESIVPEEVPWRENSEGWGLWVGPEVEKAGGWLSVLVLYEA